MCRERAIDIVKHLNLTIANMPTIEPTIYNEVYAPTRTTKKNLNKIKDRLIRKYKLKKDN